MMTSPASFFQSGLFFPLSLACPIDIPRFVEEEEEEEEEPRGVRKEER